MPGKRANRIIATRAPSRATCCGPIRVRRPGRWATRGRQAIDSSARIVLFTVPDVKELSHRPAVRRQGGAWPRPETSVTETVADILRAHRAGTMTPEQTVARSFARIRAHGDPAVFISLRDEHDVVAEARALTSRDLKLYGIPVAVKDNMEPKGLPPTAACAAFAYQPGRDATAVARLRQAGAIVIGKTNLDQFATGLVGLRSPYGVPRNTLDPTLIPGGLSSGSAVAVASGLVPLALGTDTAGSGRIPALLNNIVGLKPSLGLVSTHGVVPACRTLDCVSVFALTVDDAWTALAAMAGPDRAHPYSRNRRLGTPGAMPPHMKLGAPRIGQRLFFGDRQYEIGYGAALERLARLGAD